MLPLSLDTSSLLKCLTLWLMLNGLENKQSDPVTCCLGPMGPFTWLNWSLWVS